MSNFASWISPELLRTLGWTLLHFLWQGAGLAALFAVATAVCRSAPARYALAVGALVLMMQSRSPARSYKSIREIPPSLRILRARVIALVPSHLCSTIGDSRYS